MYISDNWDTLYSGRDTNVAMPTQTAKFVEKTERATDSYGNYFADDSSIYVIFEVDGRFFRKQGYQSSYNNERTWEGPVVEVFPKTKTVTVYETGGK